MTPQKMPVFSITMILHTMQASSIASQTLVKILLNNRIPDTFLKNKNLDIKINFEWIMMILMTHATTQSKTRYYHQSTCHSDSQMKRRLCTTILTMLVMKEK